MLAPLFFGKSWNEFSKSELNNLLNALGLDVEVNEIFDNKALYKKSDDKLDGIGVLLDGKCIANLMVSPDDLFENDSNNDIVRKEIKDFNKFLKSNNYILLLISSTPMVEDLIYYKFKSKDKKHVPIVVCSLRNIEPDKRPDFIEEISYVN